MGQLDGKVAIVTGATSGIGERIAEVFVAEGARVVGAGRREREGRALQARCGPALSFVPTDVTDETSVKAMVAHAVAHFGRLDCLVNNAGSGSPMVSIAEVTSEHFSSVFDTNVRGVLLARKHAAPLLIAQGSGTIITIGSVGGLRGATAGHIYSASKAAAIHLSRCVAGEVSGRGVRVNTISPGGIITGIFAKAAGLDGIAADLALDAVSDLFTALQPVPRAGVTDDIAHVAVFLASDSASFITGQDIVVDGGFVPFGKYGWQESLALRAEIARRVRAQIEPLA